MSSAASSGPSAEPGAAVLDTTLWLIYSDSLGEKTAVHAKIDSGDETARARTCEKNDRADEFVCFPKSLHWRVTQNGLRTRCRRAVVIVKEPLVLFCRKKSGR